MKNVIVIATLCACACGAAAQAGSATSPAPLVTGADDASLTWGPCPDFLPEGCGIAVLRGDPAAGSSEVFFRVPGGAEITRHWHTSAERMVLVNGEMQVTYDGHPTTLVTKGSYAYGPARIPHTARCVSDSACVLMIAFDLPVDAFEGGHASD